MENLTYSYIVNERTRSHIHVIGSKYLFLVKAILIDCSWLVFLVQFYDLLFTFSSSTYLLLSCLIFNSVFCDDFFRIPNCFIILSSPLVLPLSKPDGPQLP